MYTRRMRLLSIGLLLALLIGCASPTQTAPPSATATVGQGAPRPTQTGVAYAIGEKKPLGFASIVVEPVAVEPRVPAYDADPHAARNADLLARLAPAQVDFLRQNGLVILAQGPQQIYQIYKQAASAEQPAFVTTDALLHAYHVLYDYTLRQVEQEHLVNDLRRLLAALIVASEQQIQDAQGLEPVREAATRNLAYLVVAQRLLTPDSPVPGSVDKPVREELALIDARAGLAISPIFGYQEDYSQYVPRGHYTRSETLQRYFRGMMWLGRMAFRLRPGDTEAAIAAGRMETRQALLLVAALHNASADGEEAMTLWDRIYEPTSFFVGRSDDLNAYDYGEALRQVFGGQLDLSRLAQDEQIDTFIQVASALRPPQVVSSLVTDREDAAQVTKGLRLMGQRLAPDAYILQQLVYDQVRDYQGQGQPFTMELTDAGPARTFPRGLDVAAVLGSERALDILAKEGDTAYLGYDEQMAKLRQEFASLPAGQWQENLYWNWLNTLRPLLEPKGVGYPAFMRSPAWLDKGLNTFLGSWTELRHDTILYAKQSYSVQATSMRPQGERLPGYVEPEVVAWERLLALVQQTRAGLARRQLLDDEFEAKLSGMEDVVRTLRDISVAELSNQPLDERQVAFIEQVGAALENLTTFSAKVQQELTTEADQRMALVADVHTDVNSGKVLEEGVGDPFILCVLVPDGQGGTLLTIGGIFSQYEFKQPMDQRLTDEAWQQMQPRPPLAPWFQALTQE